MKRKKSELIIDITVRATNTRKYEEVRLKTLTLRFEPSGEPIRSVVRFGQEIGFSEDLNPVFLDCITIQPRMMEMKSKNNEKEKL